MNGYKSLLAAALAPLLAACTVGPRYQAPEPAMAAHFEAPLPQPAAGASAAQPQPLSQWWRQFDDPLVGQLVEAALADNPGLDAALARIGLARATLAGQRSTLLPEVAANASAERDGIRSDGRRMITNSVSRSIDAHWEIDLFGGRRLAGSAALARQQAREDDWHAARVSLMAEVATTVVDYRACAATAAILELDAGSRDQTAQLTRLKIKAGFAAADSVLLIDASGAAARQDAVARRATCDLLVKSLVALTGVAEPDLRRRLGSSARVPRPAAMRVEAVPAKVLLQRPDVAAAERELKAANDTIGAAMAQRYPSISLDGSIGLFRLGSGGAPVDAWALLPAVNLPLFDGGRRRADVSAAQAAYEERYAAYRQTVRAALRESEDALVRLDAAARRETDAVAAARDYEGYFKSSETRFKAGPLSLFELEDARRTALGAQQTLIAVQQERVNAWIALYKALGGGWTPNQAVAPGA